MKIDSWLPRVWYGGLEGDGCDYTQGMQNTFEVMNYFCIS